jgi:hypothetical protein
MSTVASDRSTQKKLCFSFFPFFPHFDAIKHFFKFFYDSNKLERFVSEKHFKPALSFSGELRSIYT